MDLLQFRANASLSTPSAWGRHELPLAVDPSTIASHTQKNKLHLLGNLGVADKPGADGPDRLVSNGHVLHLLFGDAPERLGNLRGVKTLATARGHERSNF